MCLYCKATIWFSNEKWIVDKWDEDEREKLCCSSFGGFRWKPAAIFVSLVFKIIPETIDQANQTMKVKGSIENEGAKIGFWIGVLEREIILMLGLIGQFGAIGFVLTAKSLARFKQLENKSFAEKYLVGTLLSALIAIGNIVICKCYGVT